MLSLVPDGHHHRIDRRREATIRIPDVVAHRLRSGDRLVRRVRHLLDGLTVRPRDGARLVGEDARLAPANIDNAVNSLVHVLLERRHRGLEDSLEANRHGFACTKRRIVGDLEHLEAERTARTLATDLVPVLLATHRDAALAAVERMAAEAHRLRGVHQVADHQALLHAIGIDHLPALKLPEVHGMRRVEEARLDVLAQRIATEMRVDEVVAMRPIEVEQHRGDALTRDVRDRHKHRRALRVRDAMVEGEQVRTIAWDEEALVGQLDGLPIQLVRRVLIGELVVLLRAHVALRQREDAIIVRPEQLDVVVRKRRRVRAACEGPDLVSTRRIAIVVEERPLLGCKARDTRRSGDENCLLLERERHWLFVGLEAQRPSQLGTECKATRAARKDRLEHRKRACLSERTRVHRRPRNQLAAALRRDLRRLELRCGVASGLDAWLGNRRLRLRCDFRCNFRCDLRCGFGYTLLRLLNGGHVGS